jgi:hypothetical protein
MELIHVEEDYEMKVSLHWRRELKRKGLFDI